MRKLALSDEILLKISQPARYIGGEVNMVKKDPSKVAVRFAMCFPDVYEMFANPRISLSMPSQRLSRRVRMSSISAA